jgi:hypothetical protein
MDTTTIIHAIDAEIARLQQAKALLSGKVTVTAKHNSARSAATGTNGAPAPRKRRRLSAQARARIAAAQKLRWARVRAAAKK